MIFSVIKSTSGGNTDSTQVAIDPRILLAIDPNSTFRWGYLLSLLLAVVWCLHRFYLAPVGYFPEKFWLCLGVLTTWLGYVEWLNNQSVLKLRTCLKKNKVKGCQNYDYCDSHERSVYNNNDKPTAVYLCNPSFDFGWIILIKIQTKKRRKRKLQSSVALSSSKKSSESESTIQAHWLMLFPDQVRVSVWRRLIWQIKVLNQQA